MKEDPIMVITNYVKQHLFSPDSDWPDLEFRQRVYEIWAANEMIDILMKPIYDPYLAILYFRQKMDKFYSISENLNSELMFKTARDMAEEIISLF